MNFLYLGGCGLCEYTNHLSHIDYVVFSGRLDVNVLEFVDHQHEQLVLYGRRFYPHDLPLPPVLCIPVP